MNSNKHNNSKFVNSLFSAPKKKQKEEIYLERVYRENLFQDIKNDLGEGFTDQDAEAVLQEIIDQHKTDGTFQSIIDTYFEKKLAIAKKEFESPSNNSSKK